MSHHVHIDRRPELDRFDAMLHGRQEERILLIEAPSGRGKTWLLLECQKRAGQAGVPCALVDLRVGGVGVSDALATLGEEFGWERLGRFQRQVAEWDRPAADVTIHGVVQIGRPQIQVVLGGPDEQTRRERRRVLTDALIADLREWLGPTGRAVIIVDTYNVAGADQEGGAGAARVAGRGAAAARAPHAGADRRGGRPADARGQPGVGGVLLPHRAGTAGRSPRMDALRGRGRRDRQLRGRLGVLPFLSRRAERHRHAS